MGTEIPGGTGGEKKREEILATVKNIFLKVLDFYLKKRSLKGHSCWQLIIY